MSEAKVCSFVINEGCFLEPADVTDLSLSWVHDPVCRWIDIEGASGEQTQEHLEKLELHPLIIECCVEPGRGSRVAAYNNALFIEFPLRQEWSDTERTEISIICLPTTLLTLHSKPIPAIANLARDFSHGEPLLSATTSALLYGVLDHFVDDSARFLLVGREEMMNISFALDDDSDSVKLADVVTLKRRASHLDAVAGDQFYCVASMRTVKSAAVPIGDLRDYFRDLSDVAEKVQAGTTRLETRARDLYQDFLISLQEVTSSRLRILTVLSAVYLPATLIAGIYGMNFEDIPILDVEGGYFFVMCIMIALVVGQLLFFYRRGWFK